MRYEIIARCGRRAEYWRRTADGYVQSGDLELAAVYARWAEMESEIAFNLAKDLAA